MDLTDFIAEWVPPPSRLLEVGCGAGELALALDDLGYRVTAIDPEAPDGPIFQRVSLERFRDPGPFQAVVANRSLHHIHDLDAALAKFRSLLDTDGVLILNEFAWDLLDQRTHRWYLSHLTDPAPHKPSLEPENFPEMWVNEHARLHTSTALIDRLNAHFTTEVLEWTPYMARHYLERVALESEEAEAISAGRINAIGFRYVGRKGPPQ